MASNFLDARDEPTGFTEAYLTRLRSGDDATARHFHTYFRRVLGIMLYGKFARERVDELIGKTMLAAINNVMCGEPRDPSRLVSYVRGICANITRREIANLKREDVSEVNLDRFSAEEKTAEDRLLANEKAAIVRKVLGEMSRRDRDVLTDLFYHEMDRAEVCEKYRVTAEQLRLVLFHARCRFKKKWDAQQKRGGHQ
jgi:RNA polymerase sigma factor (sigma-70 family)